MHTQTVNYNHQCRLIIIIKLAHCCRVNNMVSKTPQGKLALFDYKEKCTKKAV